MKYFGTDGIRFVVDDNLDTIMLNKIGDYFSSLKKKKKILIACDTRISADYVKSILLMGLLKKCDVIDIGIASTPCLSYLLKNNDFDFGIMISASHNPYFYNGIKILDSKGFKINERRQSSIERFIDDTKKINYKNGKYFYNHDLIKQYENFLIDSFKINNNLNIAFDLANGAVGEIASNVLSKYSFSSNLYFVNGTINYNCGATKLKLLKSIVKKNNYDLGVAFDGDGDRIQMVYKNRVIDGDDLLIYFAKMLNKDCVITSMTRRDTIEEIESIKKRYKIVNVGDSNIAKYIKKHPNYIGGETSGHIILSSDFITGDGLFVCLMFLSFINSSFDLENAFINKKYCYKSLSYKKKEYMLKKGYLNKLKKDYYKISNDKYTKFRFSGTEDILRIIIEGKNKKDINIKKKILDDLIG